MTLNSFTSVSLEPLLVLVSLGNGSRTLYATRASGRFAVSILDRGQTQVALDFSEPDRVRKILTAGEQVGRAPVCLQVPVAGAGRQGDREGHDQHPQDGTHDGSIFSHHLNRLLSVENSQNPLREIPNTASD